MTEPLRRELAVVVPVHNGARTLGQTLDSLRQQSEPVFEVIVVDDGSTDESQAIARAHDAGAKVIALGANRGAAFARNTGLLAAQTELVAFLDQDDLWAPQRTARLLDAYQNTPGLQVLVTGERAFAVAEDSAELIASGHPFAGWIDWWPPAAELMAQLAGLDVGAVPQVEWLPRERVISGSVTLTTSYVLPRTLSLQVGGFATWARSADDWVLLQTLAAHTRIGRLPDKTVLYRVHPGNTSTTTRWTRTLLTLAAALRYGGALVPPEHERDERYVGRLMGTNLLPHYLLQLAQEPGLRSVADSWALWQLLATERDRTARNAARLARAQFRARLPPFVRSPARRGRGPTEGE